MSNVNTYRSHASEHLLVLAVQTLSRETRQEENRHRRGTYPLSHWLSLAEEPKQLRRSWRKLLRSHPLRRSQSVFGEAAPATRAQDNSRTDGSCVTQRFPHRGFRGSVSVFGISVAWEQLESRTGQISPKADFLIRRKVRRAIGLKTYWFTLRSGGLGVRISSGAPCTHSDPARAKTPQLHSGHGAPRRDPSPQ
jgi:hypothetical protein